jgi:hypothetical protein
MIRACCFTVDSAGKHGRTRRLGNFKRLAGQIRLVHLAVAFDDDSIHRADLIRKNGQPVTQRYLGK